MSCRKRGPRLLSGYRSRRVALHGIVGWSHLFPQPGFDGAFVNLKCAQPIADDLTLRGILAGLYPGADHLGHFMGQCNAELLCSAHTIASSRVGFNPTIVWRTISRKNPSVP